MKKATHTVISTLYQYATIYGVAGTHHRILSRPAVHVVYCCLAEVELYEYHEYSYRSRIL